MTGHADEVTISIFLEIDFPIAMEMESESDDKQDNITFSMIGLPAHNIKDYDLKVKLQRLRGNNELPYGK